METMDGKSFYRPSINPDACQEVCISDCAIDVGGDCIAIKSGTEKTPNRRAAERVVITSCHFLHGHGGVVLGSEMSGDLFFEKREHHHDHLHLRRFHCRLV